MARVFRLCITFCIRWQPKAGLRNHRPLVLIEVLRRAFTGIPELPPAARGAEMRGDWGRPKVLGECNRASWDGAHGR